MHVFSTLRRFVSPWTLSVMFGFVLSVAIVFTVSCQAKPLPTPDPDGKDLTKGIVVAAVESTGGIRTYKIVHVDNLPEPMGPDLHMIVYEQKAYTFEEAAETRARGAMKIAKAHISVRQVLFITRDHRVIATEPVTEDEMAPYVQSRDRKR